MCADHTEYTLASPPRPVTMSCLESDFGSSSLVYTPFSTLAKLHMWLSNSWMALARVLALWHCGTNSEVSSGCQTTNCSNTNHLSTFSGCCGSHLSKHLQELGNIWMNVKIYLGDLVEDLLMLCFQVKEKQMLLHWHHSGTTGPLGTQSVSSNWVLAPV